MHSLVTTWFNYIRSLTCFICFIITICKTLRMSVFNKELLTYLLIARDVTSKVVS